VLAGRLGLGLAFGRAAAPDVLLAGRASGGAVGLLGVVSIEFVVGLTLGGAVVGL